MGTPWQVRAPQPPRPGIIPLRPLGLGELLDGGLQTMRRHPRLVLGAGALVAVVGQGVQVPVTYALTSSLRVASSGSADALGGVLERSVGSFSILAAVALVVSLLGAAVLSGLLTVVVGRAVLGEPVAARDCWRAVRRRLLGLIGLSLLTLLIEVVVVAVALVPLGLVLLLGGGAVAAATLGVLGGLVGVLAAVAAGVLLSLAPPAYVLEGGSMIAALRRSVALVRARFWPVLGMIVLTVVIARIVVGAISLPFSVAGQLLTAGQTSDAATALPALVLTTLGTVVGLTATLPFTAAVVGLLYVDARMRREGFDIELQLAASAASSAASSAPRSAAT